MLGKNINKIRLDKKIGSRELARRCGFGNSIIINIEKGKTKNPTIKVVDKIARELNVTIDDLLHKDFTKE